MPKLLRGNLTHPSAQIQSLGGPRNQPTEGSAADEEPYKYETLSKSTNIRLLKLCEGEGDIHCSLAEAAAKKAPHYRGLSYTWGSPTRTSENHSQSQSSRFIYLNQKRHAVTDNLFDALHQLRDLGVRGSLWIDAICIDQGNIDERGEQVAIMGDIYANADGVIVWLGKADNNTREAFTLISAIGLACNKADEESSMTPASFVFNDPRLYAHTDPVIQPLDVRQWRLIMEFFARTWFTRVWVLQEVVLAKNIEVFCGPVTLNYSILTDFAAFMIFSGWISHANRYADPLPLQTYLRGPWSTVDSASNRGIRFVLLAAALDRATEEAAEPLLEVFYNAVKPFDKQYAFLEMALNHSRLLDATNPRDLVYAPLSLASQFPRHESDSMNWMLPDYRQDIAKTFIDVSLLILQNSPRLTLLSEVEDRRDRKFAELPSWVPDFTVVRTSIKFSLTSQYKASACWDDIDDREQRILSPTLIRIFGSVQDTVSKITIPLAQIFHGHLFRALLEVVPPDPSPLAAKQDPIETLWRTLIGDLSDSTYPAPAYLGDSFYHLVLHQISMSLILHRMSEQNPERFWDEYTLYEEFAKTGLLPSREAVVAQAELYYQEYLELDATKKQYFLPTKLPPMHAFLDVLNLVIGERCLISTERGRLGLAPNSTKPGDSVAFVRNSRVPFTIRRVEGGRYELVGEAYIHGLMNGEIAKEGPIVLEEIILQ